jgi:LacI family transcriptional regulator
VQTLKKQDVTIKSIAEKAGVSISTVSYVISKKRKISDEVTKKVKAVMKEMGYLPNMVARNLASKKNWCIGLYAPTTKAIQHDLYFNSILVGILDLLHREGYQVLIYADYLNDQTGTHPDLSMVQPIDGALVMNPRENCIYQQYLKEMRIHHVILGMPVKAITDEFYIASDVEAAVMVAVNHLLARGYKRPALVTHQ